ncbi:MAG: hypothetical protein RSA55_08385, partial [Clostridia bacterium]
HFVLNAALYPERRVLSRMLRFIPNAALCPNAAFYPECCVLSRMLRFIPNAAFRRECRALSRMRRFVANVVLYPECGALSRMPHSIPNAAFPVGTPYMVSAQLAFGTPSSIAHATLQQLHEKLQRHVDLYSVQPHKCPPCNSTP